VAPACGFLVGLFLGQDRLGYVAGLVHMRQINFGLNALRGAERSGVCRGAHAFAKMRADLFSLMLFNRARVSLALAQPQFRQDIKNLPALDFHLACEIVDSNLAHPPLFRIPATQSPKRS
jgi:hypothetical protein